MAKTNLVDSWSSGTGTCTNLLFRVIDVTVLEDFPTSNNQIIAGISNNQIIFMGDIL